MAELLGIFVYLFCGFITAIIYTRFWGAKDISTYSLENIYNKVHLQGEEKDLVIAQCFNMLLWPISILILLCLSLLKLVNNIELGIRSLTESKKGE